MWRTKRYFPSAGGNVNSPCRMGVCYGVVKLWCLKQVGAKVLEELHDGHPRVSRKNSLARGVVWWLGIDQQVEEKVKGRESEVTSSGTNHSLDHFSLREGMRMRLYIFFPFAFKTMHGSGRAVKNRAGLL